MLIIMKVTVYFGNVRVIVPCGTGDILVRDLADLAITRYRKATGKPSTSVIRIRNLKSSRDDGILYPEDQLNDVADDREQIIADFEEPFSLPSHYNCGDGTSNSSVCTGSPDLFSVEVSSHGSVPYAHSDVEITEELPPSNITPLQVRRGSEPALNSLCSTSPTTDPSKRWSTAVVINPGSPEKQRASSVEEEESIPTDKALLNGDAKMPSRNFTRGSGRLSILGNNPETYRWVEAADRQLIKNVSDRHQSNNTVSCSSERDGGSDTSSVIEDRERTVVLKNESGPLGIHVVPDYDSKGRDTGLVIQSIEAGGRIDRDGRFCVGDRIVEINNKSLRNVSFQVAHEIFRDALKASQIKLELLRGGNPAHGKSAAVPKQPPPPVYPKPTSLERSRKTEEELVEGEERVGGVITKVATVTPTKKMPAPTTHRLATANTRRIGKKISIQLTKGTSGLGFSVTTRDNPAGGNSPIYIKNILPKGAAIVDGKLQPGDRLLEVNGIEMTGKSQSEAVQILRKMPMGGIVNLVVSRQEVDTSIDEQENNNPSNMLNIEDETNIFPWKHREILTFQIPLHDTGSAGLGVSVKGKSTTNTANAVDLGIFIKSIIPGGAASKDGRLQPDDQLVNINGISLLGFSNSDAMETLRKAMTQMDGPIPNAIILTIARKMLPPSADEQDNSSVHSRSSKLSSHETLSMNSVTNTTDKNPQKENVKNREFPIKSETVSVITSVSTQVAETINNHKVEANPPGCNPVIERLTGQSSGHFRQFPAAELFLNHSNSHHKLLSEEKNKSSYSPTTKASSCESVLIEDEYSPTTVKIPQPLPSKEEEKPNQSTNSENNTSVSKQLSVDDENAGFERDGFGRQSMSEKRHAQLDAKNTDTYQRNKKAREDRDRNHPENEETPEIQQGKESSHSSSASQLNGAVEPNAEKDDSEPRGPSLGLRKSSSLESLQTMIQELNKDDEALKNTLQPPSNRGSRSRGCNESFRAAVDRSYDAPPPSTMETLDEESESGSSVGHILGRNTETPDSMQPQITRAGLQDDILNMYCRSSKSKKKGLLKNLGSVFKFGKTRKSDGKGKYSEESCQDHTQPVTSHYAVPKEQERPDSETKVSDIQKKPLPSIPRESSSSSEIQPSRQERIQNLREQHQRLHQKRQGHYPMDHKEELYESEMHEKESKLMSSIEVSHARSRSHDELGQPGSRQVLVEPSQYSHYMNYKEIQKHMNQYYHHDQAQLPSFLHPKTTSGNLIPHKVSVHPERPSSNYFEYESVQQLHRHLPAVGNDVDTSSLPRSAHIPDHQLPHKHAQVNKHYYMHASGNGFEQRNLNHYYPNAALYSHVVPGSKV